MHAKILLAAGLTATALSSPLATRAKSPLSVRTSSQNTFQITNFVFGCTTTCDWSFDVTNTNSQLPGHPGFSTPVHCKGSKGTTTSFEDNTCGSISDTQRVAAYIADDDTLNLQYRVNVPQEGYPGATYWFEGGEVVGAATGYNPSPPAFDVPETKAYAIA